MIELKNEIAALQSEVSQLRKATDAWKSPTFKESLAKESSKNDDTSKTYFFETLPSSDVWCRGEKRIDRYCFMI
jgi:hypothetical protein